MTVDFTPEQEPFVRQAIESGRINRPEDAVQEAFSLWVERERYARLRPFGNRLYDNARANAAAERILERREHHVLPDGVTIRDMIDEGRD